MDEEIIILSVGGSLIVPDKIDSEWLKELKKKLSRKIKFKE